MARFEPIKNSFVAGALSPLLDGRDDLTQYRNGARRILNMIVLPQGGVVRRPGTEFISKVADEEKKHRLIPFKYSATNVYVCEFGHYTLRFYVNGGILMSGMSPVVVTTPYSETDIKDLQWAQEADVLYLVHPNHPPYKLSRLSPTSFSLAAVQFSKGRAPLGPYNVNKSIYITSNAVGTGYDRLLTFNANHGISAPADIGRTFHVYRYRKTASVKFRAATFTIAAVPAANQLGVNVTWEYEAGDAANITGEDSYTWALGLFSSSEGCNAITFHEGRLFYGGFKRKPDYFVGSVSDDFDNFEMENIDPDIDDSFNEDKAVARRTVSREVNAIRWLASTGQALLIGTSGAEFVARGTTDGIMTPAGTVVKAATVRGSEPHMPVTIDGAAFFIQRGGKSIRRFGYDFEADQFSAVDLTVLGENLFKDGVFELAYHQTPYSTIWAVRNDGKLIGLTYERDQEILALHLHELGGPIGAHHPVVVESICVVPGSDGNDELWLLVKRTVGSSTRRTVERMSPMFRSRLEPEASRWEKIAPLEDARYLDHHVVYSAPIEVLNITGGPTTTVYTLGAHGLGVGQWVRLRGIGGWTGPASARKPWGMAEVDNRSFKILSVPSSTSFTISDETGAGPLDSTNYSAFADPDGNAAAHQEIVMVSGLGSIFSNELVTVVGDGGLMGDIEVNSGNIELPHRASKLVIGYPYVSLVETMRISGGNPRGSDQGRPISIPRVTFRFFETATALIGRGPSPSKFEEMTFRIGQDPLDRPPPMLSGDKRISLPGSWDDQPTIIAKAVDPLPMSILSMTIEAIAGVDA